jgi:hypothetical protein
MNAALFQLSNPEDESGQRESAKLKGLIQLLHRQLNIPLFKPHKRRLARKKETSQVVETSEQFVRRLSRGARAPVLNRQQA